MNIQSHATSREKYWSVHDRDEAECVVCGADGPLEVHHKDGDWLNNCLYNLFAVCRSCHKREHKRRRTQDGLNQWKSELEALGEA